MRILEQKKVKYNAYEYPHGDEAVDGESVARLLGQNPEQVFKTLVTRGASKAYYVFVIPVKCELDLKKAAKAVAEKSIDMIHVSEINKLTGYIRGGCSPVGMKKQFETTFAKQVEQIETVIVSAGKIGYQVEVKPQELIALIQGKSADITIE
jgi:Cys-tRNA(Pro)/Cys-tRNA(Cys) deacylase